MMAWLPFLGILLGFVGGLLAFSVIKVPGELASAYAPYLSLATLSGLDTVFGGIRAGIEGRFQDRQNLTLDRLLDADPLDL